ncbi:MAG: hypothetical protein KAS32_20850, partial [Candidatus Peribacteraceae bacterium]|nr:hypothetical protein [Candidatus Peribacteraceae bacterium]
EDLFVDNNNEGSMLKKPISMMLENIPTCEERGEGAHEHMDFLFLARPLSEKQAIIHCDEEAHETKWFTREEIEKLDENTEIFSNVKRYILIILPQINNN